MPIIYLPHTVLDIPTRSTWCSLLLGYCLVNCSAYIVLLYQLMLWDITEAKLQDPYNWRAPSKRGVCTYFVVIFQCAQNPLKFGMQTLFLLKKTSNTFLKVPPPPSNSVKHTHAQCFGSQGSKSYIVWIKTEKEGGGGEGLGWIFTQYFAYFSALLKTKKPTGTFFKSTCQISVDSEQLEKSQRNRYIRLSSMEPFN